MFNHFLDHSNHFSQSVIDNFNHSDQHFQSPIDNLNHSDQHFRLPIDKLNHSDRFLDHQSWTHTIFDWYGLPYIIMSLKSIPSWTYISWKQAIFTTPFTKEKKYPGVTQWSIYITVLVQFHYNCCYVQMNCTSYMYYEKPFHSHDTTSVLDKQKIRIFDPCVGLQWFSLGPWCAQQNCILKRIQVTWTC